MIAHSSSAMATNSLATPGLRCACVRTPIRNAHVASCRGALQIVAAKGNLDEDSYQKVEEPVRDTAPDQGPPLRERQSELDRAIVSSAGNKEKEILGTDVSIADSFRFKGALPEIANSRLAMLGVVSAMGYEIIRGKSLIVQINEAPVLIALTFLTITVASAVPILRGEKRKDAKEWGGLPAFTADAELINGRAAMVGFAGLVITEALKGGPLFGQ